MNSRQIASLAFKVLGIVAILQSPESLSSLLGILAWNPGAGGFEVNRPLAAIGPAISLVVFLGGGFLLIAKSGRLADLTTRDSAPASASVTAADLHSILLSSVGLLLIGLSIRTLPSVLHNLSVFYSAAGPSHGLSSTASDTWIWLSGIALQLAFGLGLVLRSSTIVLYLRRRLDRAKPAAADLRCPHCGFWFDMRDYRSGAAAYRCGNCKQEITHGLPAPDRV